MNTNRTVVVLVIALVVCLVATFNYRTAPYTVTINVDGRSITTLADQVSPDDLMIPKAVAEQALNIHIGWNKPAPLPKGVYYRDQVAVLMYHHLSEEPMPHFPWVLSAERFDEQMKLLNEEGFHVITMEQYQQFIRNNGAVPDNAVLLTFDDGYESFYKLAFPILQKYGYTAVNFVIVSTIDKPNKHSVPKLTWEQMREMKQAGMGFYNHTYDLHHYGIVDAEGGERPAASSLLYIADEIRNEWSDEYYSRVKRDLARAELRLKEELGNTDSAIAFPYGSYNDRLLEICDSLGIELKFKIKEGLNSKGDINGYRINAGSESLTSVLTLDQMKHMEQPMELTVNNHRVDFVGVRPEIRKGILMVPFRELCKDLHIHMEYDRRSKVINLTNNIVGI